MEHAVYDATANLMQWLEEDYGVPPRDIAACRGRGVS